MQIFGWEMTWLEEQTKFYLAGHLYYVCVFAFITARIIRVANFGPSMQRWWTAMQMPAASPRHINISAMRGPIRWASSQDCCHLPPRWHSSSFHSTSCWCVYVISKQLPLLDSIMPQFISLFPLLYLDLGRADEAPANGFAYVDPWRGGAGQVAGRLQAI